MRRYLLPSKGIFPLPKLFKLPLDLSNNKLEVTEGFEVPSQTLRKRTMVKRSLLQALVTVGSSLEG